MAVTRRTVLKALLASGVGTVSGVGAYGFLYGRHELEVTRTTVPVTGLPPALSGLRIGLMTDIHRSALVPRSDVTRAVDAMTEMSAEAHENGVKRIFPRLGETGTTADLVTLLDATRR
jgi:hypothetical protein